MYLVHKFVRAHNFVHTGVHLSPVPRPRLAFRMVKQATESWAGPGDKAMFIYMSIFRYRGKILARGFLRQEEGGSHFSCIKLPRVGNF